MEIWRCFYILFFPEEKNWWESWIHLLDIYFSSLDIQIATKFCQSAREHLQREGMKRVWGQWRGPDRPELLLSATSMTKSDIAWSFLFILFWIFLVIDTSNGAKLCIKIVIIYNPFRGFSCSWGSSEANIISSATHSALTKGSKVLDWFCFSSIFASQTP